MSNFNQARRCIIPKDPNNRFIKFDKSSLELEAILFMAGYKRDRTVDPFTELVSKVNGAFTELAKLTGKDERFIAKTSTYANLYGEGMTLYTESDLKKPKFREAVDCGALILYDDWEYCGYGVGFSGINMAERLFKDASLENRAKVNNIVENHLMRIYPIRKWQKEVCKEAETGLVKSITGRYLKLYDSPKDSAKASFSFKGQGLGTDHVQTVILDFYDEYGDNGIPTLMVHDELVFEKPKSWAKEQAIDFMSVAEREDTRIPRFSCPVKMYWGENWAQLERIK